MSTDAKTISPVEKAAVRKMMLRLLPFLMFCYFIAYIDRVNIGFAALTMNKDVGLTASIFGFGATLFFVAYVLFEMPSNVAMEKFGARRWIARIMITWGIVGFCTAFITGPISFGISRFLLGAAEAGFFPGVLLYLTTWFPKAYMARIVAVFMVAVPLSNFIGSPLSVLLLKLDGLWGYRGWQWLLMLEALPAVIMGIATLFFLPSKPSEARWLTDDEKNWLSGRLEDERKEREHSEKNKPHKHGASKIWAAMSNKWVLLLAVIYMSISATSNTLSLWMPQILKSFHLTDTQTGLLNMIPFGLGAAFMIFWGMRADKTGDRIFSTAVPMAIMGLSFVATLMTDSLVITLILLSMVLISNFALKGPFWALTGETLPPGVLAVGIAAVNTLGHLGTGTLNYFVGVIRDKTGSFPLALLPIAGMCFVGVILVFYIGSQNAKSQKLAEAIR
ncbi:MFS transporter [Pseudomonas sp. CDFA 553]|uniref:MFS transporter n=1 Tax=Pseudomonas quasicaspiana TaxID=2829821 RepID=UPI001E5D8560|nr:MFS transporter [Pseudomonas quasicaspiana]MCD5987212.1 MFS transporter [Pseudomonas quasicaspiana]